MTSTTKNRNVTKNKTHVKRKRKRQQCPTDKYLDVKFFLSGLLENDQTRSPENTIVVYTDGYWDAKTGRGGCGIYIAPNHPLNRYQRIKPAIGNGDNNFMEVEAAKIALTLIASWKRYKNETVIIRTDSLTLVNAMTTTDFRIPKGSLASQILELHNLVATFANVVLFEHVRAHCGDPGNEQADHLSRVAIGRVRKPVVRDVTRRRRISPPHLCSLSSLRSTLRLSIIRKNKVGAMPLNNLQLVPVSARQEQDDVELEIVETNIPYEEPSGSDEVEYLQNELTRKELEIQRMTENFDVERVEWQTSIDHLQAQLQKLRREMAEQRLREIENSRKAEREKKESEKVQDTRPPEIPTSQKRDSIRMAHW